MGSASSKASNRAINETINSSMNRTLVNQTQNQTLSTEENSRTTQTIEVYSDGARAIAIAAEAADVAVQVCGVKDLNMLEVVECIGAIKEMFMAPSCPGGINISQISEMDINTTQQLISVNAAEVESALKADLQTAYDNSQDGTAQAQPPLMGEADSEVDQSVRNTTVNKTINDIAMNMRSEIENFQKKNQDSTQSLKIELFPGMTDESCNFNQDAAIKSVTNIGTHSAMSTIAKAQSELETDTSAKNTQVAKALAGGGGSMIMIIIILIIIGAVGYYFFKKSKGGDMGGGSYQQQPPRYQQQPPQYQYQPPQYQPPSQYQKPPSDQNFGKRMV